MTVPSTVVVVGGGVSGLSAAHRLQELTRAHGLPLRVVLLEASGRLGGVVSTRRVDGFVLDEGPDSLLMEKPWARALAERIGISGRFVPTGSEHKRSFVVRRGGLEPTPEGFHLLAPSSLAAFATTRILGPLGKLRAGADLILPRRRADGDESVGAFVHRRLGRQVLERLAQPMIAGVYGPDPHRLSLQATFPRFLAMERKHGSVIRAMRSRAAGSRASTTGAPASGARYGLFASFDDGVQVLTDALVKRLEDVTLRTGTRAAAIERSRQGWTVLTSDGAAESAKGVIVAVPAPIAAPLVDDIDPTLSRRLESIPYGSAATVSLAFRSDDVPHPLDGFGFVVPAIERLSITGCTFVHRKYPSRCPEGFALLRVFWGDPSTEIDDEALVTRTLRDLRRVLGGPLGDPVLVHTARWPRSMPQYAVGHLDLVSAIEGRLGRLRGLALAGNAYRGIGVPDCIHSGESAAERIIEQLST